MDSYLCYAYILTGSHRTDEFDCGRAGPNRWLRKRALASQDGTAWTIAGVIDGKVMGYYTLMPGRVELGAGGSVRRCAVMMMPWLAVDRNAPLRMRKELLRDAVARTLRAAEPGRMWALLAYAANEEDRRFYESYDFRRARWDPWLMVLRLANGRKQRRG
jgi:hypothetical protein